MPESARNTPERARSRERASMVQDQLEARGVRDARVLEAFRRVPRHRFVPADQQDRAYADAALPIGFGVTISQPYVAALMTEQLRVRPGQTLLEIGGGSGYQAAILAELGACVVSLEILEPLAERAADVLEDLGYGHRILVLAGDGSLGWPDRAPYDGVIFTCAVPDLPPAVAGQLRVGGRLVVPLGRPPAVQKLMAATKTAPDQYQAEELIDVLFVPLTGPGA